MAEIKVTLSKSYYEQILGAETARNLPESVIRDAESSVERYLLNHSEEFQESIKTAVGKSLDDNRQTLLVAGIDLDGEEDDDEENKTEEAEKTTN